MRTRGINNGRGICDVFYEYFSGHGTHYWGRKEDFEYALACEGDDWYIKIWGQDAVARIRAEFRRDFVDNYVFGASLLWPSF